MFSEIRFCPDTDTTVPCRSGEGSTGTVSGYSRDRCWSVSASVPADHGIIRMGSVGRGMADNKNSRENRARDADDRQRQRAVLEALERGDESEPPVAEADLGDVDEALDAVEFPATAKDIVETVGDRVVGSPDETYAVADLIPESETVAFEAPEAVRTRVMRPTVAASMKRVVEASDGLKDRDRLHSQYDAYEKTLVALADIDADDEDEGVAVVTDWIVEQIAEKGTRPGSRRVRKRAAAFCREQGFEVRDDQWLGA